MKDSSPLTNNVHLKHYLLLSVIVIAVFILQFSYNYLRLTTVFDTFTINIKADDTMSRVYMDHINNSIFNGIGLFIWVLLPTILVWVFLPKDVLNRMILSLFIVGAFLIEFYFVSQLSVHQIYRIYSQEKIPRATHLFEDSKYSNQKEYTYSQNTEGFCCRPSMHFRFETSDSVEAIFDYYVAKDFRCSKVTHNKVVGNCGKSDGYEYGAKGDQKASIQITNLENGSRTIGIWKNDTHYN